MAILGAILKDVGLINEFAMADFEAVKLDNPVKAAIAYVKKAKERGLDAGKIIKGLPSTVRGLKRKFESDSPNADPKEFFSNFERAVKENLKTETEVKKVEKKEKEKGPNGGAERIKAAAKKAYDVYSKSTLAKIKTEAGLISKTDYLATLDETPCAGKEKLYAHDTKKYTCKECGKEFSKKSVYKEHTKEHKI